MAKIAAPLISLVVALTLVTVVSLQAAAPAAAQLPIAKSTAQAKELQTLLQSKKLEAFAVRDPLKTDRFIAVLGIPNVQLLVVAAAFERPSDIEYRLYQKDYLGAYADLKSSIFAKDRVFVEDMAADGLRFTPPKEQTGDSVVMGADKHVFDGDFADPKKKNQKKISQEDYTKAFSAADERYSTLLGWLITELKK